jgi:hypothetical protein
MPMPTQPSQQQQIIPQGQMPMRMQNPQQINYYGPMQSQTPGVPMQAQNMYQQAHYRDPNSMMQQQPYGQPQQMMNQPHQMQMPQMGHMNHMSATPPPQPGTPVQQPPQANYVTNPSMPPHMINQQGQMYQQNPNMISYNQPQMGMMMPQQQQQGIMMSQQQQYMTYQQQQPPSNLIQTQASTTPQQPPPAPQTPQPQISSTPQPSQAPNTPDQKA